MKKIVRFIRDWIKNLRNPAISLFARVEQSNIAKKSRIYRRVKIVQSTIRDYTYIAPKTTVLYASIGKFCSIGRNCNIGLAKHPIHFISTSPLFFSPNNATGYRWVNDSLLFDEFEHVTIGNDVWIGQNATIMGGVNVGDGAIIGAGAVVTKNVPPYAIVGGVPAKVIKYRFNNDIIENLQNFQWWEMSDNELKSKIEMFQTPTFIQKL